MQVPEYKGLYKPKHHFAQHTPLDILRCGPPRGYWCFAFEAFNQKMKKYCKNSSFKDITRRVADFFVLDSALMRMPQTRCSFRGRSLMRM